MPPQQLLRQPNVTLRPLRPRIVHQRRLPMARRPRPPTVPRHRRGAQLLPKEFFQLRNYLLRQIRALIQHGQHHAFDFKSRIQLHPNSLDCIQELADAFQRKIFRWHRNQDRVGCHQGVQRQQIERWRTVQDNVLEPITQRRDHILQSILTPLCFYQLNICADKILVRRNDPELLELGCGQRLLTGGISHEQVISGDTFRILHKNLIGANIELVEAERREYRLKDVIAPLRDRFQYIVLDCPPALDLLTLNALVAADSVLIPMQAEYFALEGISELLDTVERIRVELNPGLEIEGVVLTMLDERTNLAQQVIAELKKFFGEKLCAATVPRNIRLAEAPSHGKPALVYDPRSKGAESYIRLAKELLGRHLAAVGDAQAAKSA